MIKEIFWIKIILILIINLFYKNNLYNKITNIIFYIIYLVYIIFYNFKIFLDKDIKILWL